MEDLGDKLDNLEENLGDNLAMTSSASAFRLVRPCPRSSSPCTSGNSPPYSSPQGMSPPPYFSTSSPPGWYSSLLSSLYHSSTALRCKELNNNSSDGETNENTEKEIKKEGKKSAGN